jgi:DNA-binding LacI/PurR family transcriptional regulator
VASNVSERLRPTGSAPTVNDVARLANVSRQTVSNVINAPERVRESTRRRVEEAIATLGYHSNRIGRSLQGQSSRMIGYRIPPAQRGDFTPILDRFLHALTVAARERGYQVLLFLPQDGQPEADSHEEMLSTATVDGLVLTDTTPEDPRVAFLARQQLPFVTFGRTRLDVTHPWVDVDGAAGIRAAVRHLVAAGHRRIAFVGHGETQAYASERLSGYREGMADAGLVPDAALEFPLGTSGADALRDLLALSSLPTAFIVADDLTAIRLLETAQALGRVVGPDGLSIVGFDDIPLASMVHPALTTIRQPIERVAHEIIRLLLARMAGDLPEGVLLEPELVVRSSA